MGKLIKVYYEFRLLNKQDLYDAMDEADVCQLIHLNDLINKSECIVKVVSCVLLIYKSLINSGLYAIGVNQCLQQT